MIPAAEIAGTYKSNHGLAGRLMDGLSHIESLIEPEFEANPLNWVLGHIVNGRSEALAYLDSVFDWSEAEAALYRTGSDPIMPETALRLEDLSARFDASQADLEAALAAVSAAFMAEVVDTRFGERTRWQHLAGLAWHETYHIGQMELLRSLALAGREDGEGDSV